MTTQGLQRIRVLNVGLIVVNETGHLSRVSLEYIFDFDRFTAGKPSDLSLKRTYTHDLGDEIYSVLDLKETAEVLRLGSEEIQLVFDAEAVKDENERLTAMGKGQALVVLKRLLMSCFDKLSGIQAAHVGEGSAGDAEKVCEELNAAAGRVRFQTWPGRALIQHLAGLANNLNQSPGLAIHNLQRT